MKQTNGYVSQRIAIWMLSKGAISFSDRFSGGVVRYLRYEGVDVKVNEATFKKIQPFIKPRPNDY